MFRKILRVLKCWKKKLDEEFPLHKGGRNGDPVYPRPDPPKPGSINGN